jgi:ribose-phosphate pyrophosphokinase
VIVLPLPGAGHLAPALAHALGAPLGEVEVHRFPDGEARVRLLAEPAGHDVVVVATLDHPDDKVVPLRLLLDGVRAQGGRRTVLVAPYLAYLRQDRAFHPGEVVSAEVFPRLLAPGLHGLVTVDPHLHRVARLGDVWPVDARVVHAAPALAAWVRGHVQRPLLVGPDEESGQWVADVADRAGAPHVVGRKERRGDADVVVRLPDLAAHRDRTPVLVDDILSTGATLARAAVALRAAGLPAPTVLAVHALFADDAEARLRAAGVERVVTCDTVAHPTNGVTLAPALAETVRAILG